jgi:pyruvate/2-oxoglutarate dehydrogenase complex dihydrolipoamide dehydrogenase (E3) component
MSKAAPLPEPVVAPADEHNLRLLANVRPPGWVNPEPAPRYHLVVIGAGAAGLVAAAGAAGLGAKVALIERHLLGGDCLNYGCVPSKALLRSARAAQACREAQAFGIQAADPRVDFAAVMARLRRLRADLSPNDSAQRFRDLGVDVFLGQAAFTGPDRVEVDGRTLVFRKALIATGGRPVAPNLPGLAEAGYLTNETVFSLTSLPPRLAVMGAGPIGCEFAQAFRRLGADVTLLHKYPRILNKEDEDAALLLQDVLAGEGVRLMLACRPLSVSAGPTGKRIAYETEAGRAELEVDDILVGAGRAPNVEGLNLEAAGVRSEPGKGRGVLVNDRLQTSNPRIYAAGDVCGPYQFTHLADAQARMVIQNALFFGRRKMSRLIVPWCTYTDPEVAHVGLGEAEAARQGVAVTVFRRPLAQVDRAALDGEEAGYVKILVQQGTDRILGAAVVARHAGDMLSEITTAMAAGMGLDALAGVIHPYPTQAEAIRQAGDLYRRTRLTPLVRKLFAWFFKWRL